MFDISFGELLLIGVVALVVLGPERLPTVARTVGALVARLQRFVTSVKSDIQRETNLSGLAELQSDIQDAAQTFQRRIESELAEVKASADTLRGELATAEQALGEMKDSVADAVHAADANLHGAAGEIQTADMPVATPTVPTVVAPSMAMAAPLIDPSAYVMPTSAVTSPSSDTPSTPQPAVPPAPPSHS
ncbi:Sec-independent protein translocase protein TatB [Crenobacter sp. SG2305]|uniref:Sec-independent protein translocase protein TatB n=1 Tax=Crenobacter oryzisoli TaxID=3056844 RepID=UPI0025AA8DF3|nr:Sec-independent protein translocase protein TatB [Crenobacter sp. SG2305]MDN0084326.1 Sec-independent protein translocase protein TatB [Crenobacter sp. SG2305]